MKKVYQKYRKKNPKSYFGTLVPIASVEGAPPRFALATIEGDEIPLRWSVDRKTGTKYSWEDVIVKGTIRSSKKYPKKSDVLCIDVEEVYLARSNDGFHELNLPESDFLSLEFVESVKRKKLQLQTDPGGIYAA